MTCVVLEPFLKGVFQKFPTSNPVIYIWDFPRPLRVKVLPYTQALAIPDLSFFSLLLSESNRYFIAQIEKHRKKIKQSRRTFSAFT